MELFNSKLQVLLNTFEKSYEIMSNFDLGFKIARYFDRKIDILSYENKKKKYIFYRDKSGVKNYISIYNAIDKNDGSNGIVIEYIIGENKQKDIMFFSGNKMYNIVENKWGKIIETKILENKTKQIKILEIFESDLNYIFNKVIKYKNRLRIKGNLTKQIPLEIVNRFKYNFIKKEAIIA